MSPLRAALLRMSARRADPGFADSSALAHACQRWFSRAALDVELEFPKACGLTPQLGYKVNSHNIAVLGIVCDGAPWHDSTATARGW
jgi:hypothetical protein